MHSASRRHPPTPETTLPASSTSTITSHDVSSISFTHHHYPQHTSTRSASLTPKTTPRHTSRRYNTIMCLGARSRGEHRRNSDDENDGKPQARKKNYVACDFCRGEFACGVQI